MFVVKIRNSQYYIILFLLLSKIISFLFESSYGQLL